MQDVKNIVVIGAHPDDVEVGCGGTIKKFLNSGKNVFYIVGSKGEKSGNPETKVQQLYDASSRLGIKKEHIHILNLPDTTISDDADTSAMIEDILKRVNPELIFVTPQHDRHQDHRNISNATIIAARNLKSSILFYETISSVDTFSPKIFIDISETINDKIESIKSYKDLNKIIDFISTMAKFRGHQAKTEYAEGFEVKKMFPTL